MTDRFKFRVWDTKEKRFIDHPQINPLFGCVCGYENSTYPLQIEQCTGISDKNGNLIYEGDIVRYWWNQKTNTGAIFWNNEFARFCIANNETHCPEDSNCLMFVSDKKIIEIIGNIHQPREEKQ